LKYATLPAPKAAGVYIYNYLCINYRLGITEKKFFYSQWNLIILRQIYYIVLIMEGNSMIHNNFDMKRWKLEQIKYFKKYQSTFPKNSKEYKILGESIKKLESTLE